MNAQRTYHPARFAYVAWERAPRVAAVNVQQEIEERGEHRAITGVRVTLACGHVIDCAPHFDYRVGGQHSCGKCGEAIALTLPEFADAMPANSR